MTTKIFQGRMTGMRMLSIAAMGVLPLLLAAFAAWMEGRAQAEREADAAARIVLHQVESMLDHAVIVTDAVAGLVAQPCVQAEGVLQRVASFRPYLRALLLAQGSTLYCSSATGASQQPLQAFTRQAGPLPPGRSLYLVPGTQSIPDRAAVIVALGLPDQRGVVATLDGQYLLDLLAIASPRDRLVVAIRLTGSDTVLAAPGASPLSTAGLDALPPLDSERYPFSVHGAVLPAWTAALRAQFLFRYAPFGLLAALLLALAAYRYQRRRLSIAAEIRRAMAEDEFFLQYQPILALDSRTTSGVEALMRWHKPGVGPVRPDLFFAVAEDNGMARPLTRHLFQLIQRDLQGLCLPSGFHLGINITADDLASPDLIADVHRMLPARGAHAPTLVLEITERKMVPDTDVVRANMQALRASGAKIAIDDFGTGHSSLAYLERFPVDYLKIDRGFVAAIDTDAVSAPVLETIVALGHRLGVPLVAEGIESETQASYLRDRGVQYAQGFLFARPLGAQALQSWLQNQAPRFAPGAPGSA